MKEETPFLPGFEAKTTEERDREVENLGDQTPPIKFEESVECAMCDLYGGQCPRHQKRKSA